MWQFFVTGLIIWGRALYDAYTYKEKRPEGEVAIPRTEEGAGVPLIFGRCRIREPLLVAVTDPNVDWAFVSGSHSEGDPVDYCMDMLFILGIPFERSTNTMHTIYVGDQPLVTPFGNVALEQLTGRGQASPVTIADDRSGLTFERPALVQHLFDNQQGKIGGRVEFLNGNELQELADNTFPYDPKTFAAHRLTVEAFASAPTAAASAGEIPGLRGYLSCFLFDFPSDFNHQWFVGRSPQVGAYSFDVSSFPIYGIAPRIGFDANPSDVIYSLLTGTLGKLGLDVSQIDIGSFTEAAYILWTENHGYSRVFEAGMSGREMIEDVLRQIGGILYEDPATGLIVLKLIRALDSLAGVREINVSNCETLENFRSVTAGNAANLPNMIRVKYTDRSNGFREDSAQTNNLAGSAGQSAESIPLTIEFKGCCERTLAEQLASRELDIRSRPLKTCTAVVDRTFWDVPPGGVVRLTWAPLGISMLMRVVGRNVMGPKSNSIRLDLVQEFFTPSRLDPNPATFPVHGGTV